MTEEVTQGEQIQNMEKELSYLTVLNNLFRELLTKEQIEAVTERAAILTERRNK